ncbi:GTPase Era [Myxococcota bacterium]|nr:GTPase Era [Myxococcota bacterium]MBU1380678.1 GTPase Era [Myxococcota bacterium]MBU1495886.1 GTPase Era [Myxococcota bacterium]
MDMEFDTTGLKKVKSGFVAILGRPNTGKSTLLNAIAGRKIAITSPKPQTTRENITAIYNDEEVQIAFIDTPGYHSGAKKLNRYMVSQSINSISDADVVVIVTDPSSKEDEFRKFGALELAEKALELSKPVIIVLNKSDKKKQREGMLPVIGKWSTVPGIGAVIPLSAMTGDGIDILIKEISVHLSEGFAYYPEGMDTDRSDEWIAGEVIRETIIMLVSQEIPYSIGTKVISWEDKGDSVRMEADIFVERDSQKAIIIGAKGSMVKKIGESSRKSLAGIFGRDFHVFLNVRVEPGWTDSSRGLIKLGYE